MRVRIVTLFPEMVQAVLEHSILKRARDKGLLDAEVVRLRDFTTDRHQVADDAPYGGGAGMVLRPDPFFRAVERIRGQEPNLRLILTTPQGRTFDQRAAEELARDPRTIVLLCGHYEGVDERVREGLAPEEWSVGDYVLTGGELASLVIVDAAARLIPGVLDPDSLGEESFAGGLLEYPQYTRPPEVNGLRVPEILRSGNHGEIRRWRRLQSLCRTLERRPDLLARAVLTREERAVLGRPKACSGEEPV